MKAITTKYLGPGNVRGGRIKAFDCDKNSVTLGYDHSKNSERNHTAAAKALCEKMGWPGAWSAGAVDGGYVFVAVGDVAFEVQYLKGETK